MNLEAARAELVEGVDFYREGTFVVFTETFLLRRGYCCESGCRHCPYGRARPAERGEAGEGADRSGERRLTARR